MTLNYAQARGTLDEVFAIVEAARARGDSPMLAAELFVQACDLIFASETQAYREVLLGSVLARLQDRTIDLHLPYVGHGDNAYSGRSLDIESVNPFLSDHQIPCTRGAYLAVFKRNVPFKTETRKGLRDKPGYDALLACIGHVQSLTTESDLLYHLQYLLNRFYTLREEAAVPLARVHRLSLDQYRTLLIELLATPSGGRFPVIFTLAAFMTINDTYSNNWRIEAQGINVADAAAAAGGDITIHSRAGVVVSVEVTERPVDRARVVATFNTKIGPQGIEDYLFVVRQGAAEIDARMQAHQYFAQGHEVNFVEISAWILAVLATVGKRGRESFGHILLDLLDKPETPKALKAAWNARVNALLDTGVAFPTG